MSPSTFLVDALVVFAAFCITALTVDLAWGWRARREADRQFERRHTQLRDRLGRRATGR